MRSMLKAAFAATVIRDANYAKEDAIVDEMRGLITFVDLSE
ncbi:MAG: hypothetical protein AAF943_14440 [Pseudomonadota bacterium]